MERFQAEIVGNGRRLRAFLVLLPLGSASIAQDLPPLPPVRPKELSAVPTPSPADQPPPVESRVLAVRDDDCLIRLQRAGVDASTREVNGAQAACTVETPVQLRAVGVSGAAGRIDLPDRPVLACRFAERLGQWATEVVAPLSAGQLRTDVKTIRTGPGFDCRNRNHRPSGKLSAHATGLAVDVAGFELANGEHLPITDSSSEAKVRFLSGLRKGSCGWFTTILGPGSDAAHAAHWHLDIQQHGSSENYRICQ